MKNKILEKASELFLTFGVKTITMDEIAEKMAISKKTIYEHYKNKTDLVKASSHYIFERIASRINSICNDEKQISPIKALFDIDALILECIDEDNTVEFQLQKYYPEISRSLYEKKFALITESVTENLERGIAMGLYRADLNIPVIARLYFTSSIAIKNSELFSHKDYKLSEIMHIYLVYHIRAIATKKGLKELELILKKQK
jgi:AcrR family transcriptional regulator